MFKRIAVVKMVLYTAICSLLLPVPSAIHSYAQTEPAAARSALAFSTYFGGGKEDWREQTYGAGIAADKQETALQGTWLGHETGGPPGQCSITITGDAMKFQGAIPQEWYEAKLTLTPNTTPKQATILITACGFPQYKNKTSNAIYKIEGKTLTIAINEPGNAAVPTSFDRNAVLALIVKKLRLSDSLCPLLAAEFGDQRKFQVHIAAYPFFFPCRTIGNPAFIIKLAADGTRIAFSTLLGNPFVNNGDGIAVDSLGDIHDGDDLHRRSTMASLRIHPEIFRFIIQAYFLSSFRQQ